MTIVRQRLVLAAFLVLAGALFVVALLAFGSRAWWADTDTYWIRAGETVAGLYEGSVVEIQGVPVGEVTSIQLSEEQVGFVRVDVAVEGGTVITRDAVARIERKGVSDLRYVAIEQGSAGAGMLEPGAQIPWEPTLLSRVGAQIEKLTGSADEIVARLQGILQNVEHLTAEVDPKDVDRLVDAAVAAIEGVAEVTQGLRRGVTRANTTLEGVDQLVSELREVIRANREQLRATTYNLRLASETFKSLGQELRERPSRLLLSQPPEPRELP